MTTYATMKTRIHRELSRDDISADVSAAIHTALREVEAIPLYFNRFRKSAETVAGQEYYPQPSTYLHIVSLTLVVNSNYRYVLNHLPWESIEERHTNSNYQGRPIAYATDLQQVRLHPVPDAEYRMEMMGTQSLGVPSGDADPDAHTSAWFDPQHGEHVLRARAKAMLLRERLRGKDALMEAAVLDDEYRTALRRLKGETTRRRATGRVQPGY